MVDDRTEQLADKDQTADGWREWLRISNSLNLREQPTIITALSDVDHRSRGRTTRSHGSFGISNLICPGSRVAVRA